jgi:chromosome segregation ATPase
VAIKEDMAEKEERERDSVSQRVKDAEDRISSAEVDRKKLSDILEGLKVNVTVAKNLTLVTELQFNETLAYLDELASNYSIMEDRLNQLDLNSTRQEVSLNVKNESVWKAESRLAAIIGNLTETRHFEIALQANVTRLDKDLVEGKDLLGRLQKNQTDLQTQMTKKDDDVVQLEKILKELESNSTRLVALESELDVNITALEKVIERSKLAVVSGLKNSSILTEQLEEKLEKVDKVDTQVDELRANVTEAARLLTESEKERDGLLEDLENAKVDADRAQSRATEAVKKIDKLRAKKSREDERFAMARNMSDALLGEEALVRIGIEEDTLMLADIERRIMLKEIREKDSRREGLRRRRASHFWPKTLTVCLTMHPHC